MMDFLREEKYFVYFLFFLFPFHLPSAFFMLSHPLPCTLPSHRHPLCLPRCHCHLQSFVVASSPQFISYFVGVREDIGEIRKRSAISTLKEEKKGEEAQHQVVKEKKGEEAEVGKKEKKGEEAEVVKEEKKGEKAGGERKKAKVIKERTGEERRMRKKKERKRNKIFSLIY